jgi:hypothetical protein
LVGRGGGRKGVKKGKQRRDKKVEISTERREEKER